MILKSKHFVFHFLLKQFQEENIKKVHLLVAVSAGMDSMALLCILLEIKKILNLQISVVHIHHEKAQTKKQNEFQNTATQTVKIFCKKNNLMFYCNNENGVSWSAKNKSTHNEAQLREFRYTLFNQYLKISNADYLALAHTKEDLLETRLIRLIRGTGEQGIEAMCFKQNNILRPFIKTSRVPIKDYINKQNITWCEDPSNQSINYSFRNWIRHKWLPILENKRVGSLGVLSRSLDLISDSAQCSTKETQNQYNNFIKDCSLKRDIIFCFSKAQTQKIVAYYIKQQGFINYGSSHIQELLKQMTRPQKNFHFFLLGKNWKISSHWLSVEKDKKYS